MEVVCRMGDGAKAKPILKHGIRMDGKKGDVKTWKEVGKKDKILNEGVRGKVMVEPIVMSTNKQGGTYVISVEDKGKLILDEESPVQVLVVEGLLGEGSGKSAQTV